MTDSPFVVPDLRPSGTSVPRGDELAVSFGLHADAYDQYRPRYAPGAIDYITTRGPRQVVDIGCGTGILGGELVMAGISVLGIEPDERMAQEAVLKGLDVEISTFENWAPAGRQFDAAVSGQAWHWVDPHKGQVVLANILRPSGHVFLLWNIGSMAREVMRSMDAVYEEHQKAELDAFSVILGRGETTRFDNYQSLLEADDAFANVVRESWVWERAYSTSDWLSHLLTHPQHAALTPVDQSSLFADLAECIEQQHGGQVSMEYRTLVISAELALREGVSN